MSYKVRSAICLNCQISFQGNFSKHRMFCSISCRQAYRNSPGRNPACSIEAKRKISEFAKGNSYCVGRILSTETKNKISQSLTGRITPDETKKKLSEIMKRIGNKPPANHLVLRGKKHPNWKGGKTPSRQKEYGSPEYRKFVCSVLKRDNYTCQKCGRKNGKGELVLFHVHHIASYGEKPELRYDISNGITFCRECHWEEHRGKKKTIAWDYEPKPRICVVCHQEFSIRNPRKYCPACRTKYCCPICGSTTCHHSQRKLNCSIIP